MRKFWHYARWTLRYRRLLLLAAAAAVGDALCAFAGFGTLMILIDQLLGQRASVRDLLDEHLRHPWLAGWVTQPDAVLQFVPVDPFAGFAFLLGIILVIALIGAVMRYSHQSLVITLTLRTAMRLRQHAYHRLISAPASVLMTQGTSDHLTRIVRDCAMLVRGFQALLDKSVRSVLTGTMMLGVALIVNPGLTAIFMLGLPVVGVLILRFGKVIRKAAKRTSREYGGMMAAVHESLQAIAVVKVHEAEGYERRRFNAINRRVVKQELRSRSARALSTPTVEIIGITGVMLVSLVAAYLIFNVPGAGEPKELVKVLVMLGVSAGVFKPLAGLSNELNEAAASAERLDEAIRLPVETTDHQPRWKGERLKRHEREVRFEEVSYRYPGAERSAVRGVNLRVAHGQTVALVGPNGSGKSTLLSLLPRVLAPESGAVLIDGVDTATVTLRSLRGQMAMVTQQSVLFEGTIAQNIAYGRRHETMERVIAAAQAAHAHEFISRLPAGYDSNLGELGNGLSGGQRQRLCIARAVLRDPSILILDEATSQIDADSELRINDALRQFRKGRTTFVIAHRLSTVVDADLIVVMNQGVVVDQGSHEQLLRRCEVYRLIAQKQLVT